VTDALEVDAFRKLPEADFRRADVVAGECQSWHREAELGINDLSGRWSKLCALLMAPAGLVSLTVQRGIVAQDATLNILLLGPHHRLVRRKWPLAKRCGRWRRRRAGGMLGSALSRQIEKVGAP
jgi:uncharacterized membrane protein YqaE (UPF0057 family)